MYDQGIKGHSSRSSRSMDFFLDFLHIAVGILIVILAVLSFLNPDNNLVLFPVIFMLAAILNLVNGWVKIKNLDYAVTCASVALMGVCFLYKLVEFLSNKYCFIDAYLIMVYKTVLEKLSGKTANSQG